MNVRDYPVEYYFFDEKIDISYYSEQKVGTIFSIFALVAVAIACLGLIGLITFTVEQKTKEIGVRKVLGGSVPDIILLISKEFLKWIMIANIIAWPVSYFALQGWLQNFAYRIEITMTYFITALLLAVFMVIFSISIQSVKASLKNPVDSLRHE